MIFQEESGVLLTINPRNWIGDKGYIGNNMITPFRKPAGGGELISTGRRNTTPRLTGYAG